MKKYLIPAALALASAGLFAAEKAKPVKYTATMSGLVCSGCKKTVRDSFAKMGASKIEIKAGDKTGEQTITFESTDPKLTKESAIKALGDSAEEYKILTFALVK